MTTDEFTLISGIFDTMVCLRDGYAVRAHRCRRSFEYTNDDDDDDVDGRFNLGKTFMRTFLPTNILEWRLFKSLDGIAAEAGPEHEGIEKSRRFGYE